ncbi:uncharacterized protein BJX67DRAFT_269403 [Aspergillus lucknowensis]|uniref:Uncharacterized protein n=1 Tax=Aspergillus lucknowensis TaxID=176173 RepID=A0ABR4LI01_9EURO
MEKDFKPGPRHAHAVKPGLAPMGLGHKRAAPSTTSRLDRREMHPSSAWLQEIRVKCVNKEKRREHSPNIEPRGCGSILGCTALDANWRFGVFVHERPRISRANTNPLVELCISHLAQIMTPSGSSLLASQRSWRRVAKALFFPKPGRWICGIEALCLKWQTTRFRFALTIKKKRVGWSTRRRTISEYAHALRGGDAPVM